MTTTSSTEPVVLPQRLPLDSAPAVYKAMAGLAGSIRLDAGLANLVDIRASQINGCAYCLDMHLRAARKAGESEQRLDTIAGWRDSPFYTAAERAALALTETVTLISSSHVPDSIWDEAARHFDEQELANLLARIIMINAWNRLAISVRAMPPAR